LRARAKLTNRRKSSSAEQVLRFTLTGATLGLAVGLFEAGLLYFISRVPTLLEPDVRFVIWFLAPLLDLVLFGLLGSAVGGLACLGKNPRPRRSVILAAALLGVAGAHAGWSLELVHAQVGDFRAATSVGPPLTWCAVVFALAFLLARLRWQGAIRVFDAKTAWPVRGLSKALLAVTLILLAGLGLQLAGPFESSAHTQASSSVAANPNVILITLDTVRADHLSTYGYRRPTTPNLDRLAEQGVLFEHAVAPSPWTLPSHASLFTGLLPHQHGANTFIPLPAGPWTLAEVLKAHGYQTAGFSSNFSYGLIGWGMAQGFDVYNDDSYSVRHNLASTLVGRALEHPLYYKLVRPDYYFRRNAEELNRDILRWFRHRSSRPFFLFINYFDDHYPYQAPSPYAHRFGVSPDVLGRRPDHLEAGRPLEPISAMQRKALLAGYDNCLAYLDDQVGQLMRLLAASPGWKNTIVIITSDHGEGFGEHRTYDHGWDLYWEALHVPLIIFGRGIPADVRISHLARIREIFPTVIDLALGGRPPFLRTSLRRYWTPGFRPGPFDEVAISEVTPSYPQPDLPLSISLVTPDWHYIRYNDGDEFLFDWRTDREEKVNLALSPTDLQTVHDLQERLEELVGRSVRPWRGPEYLFALGRPGYPFAHKILLRQSLPPESAGGLRVGASQAFFASGASGGSRRPLPSEQELLKSLPYH
jgi:arylsulfatase A-like enzyme